MEFNFYFLKVQQTVPGANIPKNECFRVPGAIRNIPYQVTEQRSVMVDYKKCKPVVREKCQVYEIPRYDVTREDKSGEVELDVPKCT